MDSNLTDNSTMTLPDLLKSKIKVAPLLFFLSLLQLLPFFMLQEDVAISKTDMLDYYIPQYELVATKDFAYGAFDKPVPQIINGLNRDLLVTDLNLIYVLFLLFDPFWAHVINLLLIKVIAFWGMYVFLKNNFSSFTLTQISIGSFLFSCIPFFPFFGIGIAGQPLLLNSFINFYKKKSTYVDILVLIGFAFYSSLIFTNIFIVAGAFIGCAFLTLRDKKIPYRLAFASLALFLLALLAEYRLVHATINQTFVPHRVEFNIVALSNSSGIGGFFSEAFKILSKGITHVQITYFVFIIFVVILYFTLSQKKSKSLVLAIITLIVLIGLLFGLTHSSFYSIITDKISPLKAFQVDRFYTLLPILYFTLGVICVKGILETGNGLRLKILNFTIIIALLVVFFDSFSIRAIFRSSNHAPPTYAQFYDEDTFKKIEERIGLPLSDYRMVSVGIDPSALQHNGFYTLDAYLNIYPLAYKHKFREVIAGELAKSEEIRTYFDEWGNRCYIFSSEIGKSLSKKSSTTDNTIELTINPSPLKELCSTDVYLVSTKEIINAKKIGLELIEAFKSSSDFRDNLILYKVL